MLLNFFIDFLEYKGCKEYIFLVYSMIEWRCEVKRQRNLQQSTFAKKLWLCCIQADRFFAEQA